MKTTCEKPQTYAQVVRCYRANGLLRLEAEQAWYSTPVRLKDALEKIGLAMAQGGGVANHQRRIPLTVRECARDALLGVHRELARAHGFEAIHKIVREAFKGASGLGPLYVYDTSLRIAFHKGLADHGPQAVYLIAGAKEGARLMLPRIAKAPRRPRSAPVSAFPAEFRRLAAHEIHNLLCAKRKSLADLASKR